MQAQMFTAEQRVPLPREEVFAFFSEIRGLRVTWRSRIDEWRPNERFVDVQLKGPYEEWHHTHSFMKRNDRQPSTK